MNFFNKLLEYYVTKNQCTGGGTVGL